MTAWSAPPWDPNRSAEASLAVLFEAPDVPTSVPGQPVGRLDGQGAVTVLATDGDGEHRDDLVGLVQPDRKTCSNHPAGSGASKQ